MDNHSVTGAGVLFYAPSTNRYLFLLRDKTSYSGTWGLPGGKVNRNETILDAIIRETKEEMGDVPPFRKVIPLEKFTSDNLHFTYQTFLIVVDQEFIPTLNHEHRGYCWVELQDHPKPLHPGVWKTFKFEVIQDKIKTMEKLLQVCV